MALRSARRNEAGKSLSKYRINFATKRALNSASGTSLRSLQSGNLPGRVCANFIFGWGQQMRREKSNISLVVPVSFLPFAQAPKATLHLSRRLPFLRLHGPHKAWRFPKTVRPPRATGKTWSLPDVAPSSNRRCRCGCNPRRESAVTSYQSSARISHALRP